MNLAEYEKIVPNAQSDGLTFLLPNQQCAWRVQTLYTKEPDTIAWLRKMQPGEVLFDVGANMGQYAMIAAKSGVNVHAFEPEAQNFALLVRNSAVNSGLLGGRLQCWPLALSSEFSINTLHLSNMSPGGSCHAFGEPISYSGQQKKFPYSQGSIAVTMDDFAKRLNTLPDYIKIDVDGFEHLVVRGAQGCLKHAKSVLIEINTHYPEHMEYIIPHMTHGLGFNYDSAQAEESRRKDGPFAGVGNVIFYRD